MISFSEGVKASIPASPDEHRLFSEGLSSVFAHSCYFLFSSHERLLIAGISDEISKAYATPAAITF